jgi:hypothetical protein
MATAPLPPERDHRTIGSVKRTLCAYLLLPQRIQASRDRRAAHPVRHRVAVVGIPATVVTVIIGPEHMHNVLLHLLAR